MVSIAQVAGWFSQLADRDGETLDLSRLQALTYIAQGLAVALYYEPLFASRIEAGEGGPLICELSASNCQIADHVADLDLPSPHGVEGVVEYVYRRFGALPASDLARAARGGAAWPNALARGIGTTLSYDDMCQDFGPLVSELADELADEPLQPISHEQAIRIIQREHPDLARKTAIGRAQLDAGLAVPHPPVRW